MQKEPEVYLPGDRYNRLVKALLNPEPCPFSAPNAQLAWRRNEIIVALGMAGDIWPLEIRDDTIG